MTIRLVGSDDLPEGANREAAAEHHACLKGWALLDEEEEEVAYALKSDAEDLGEHAGQHVRLSGFLVEGFPVEAGEPGYISVMEIEEAYYSEQSRGSSS